MIYLISSINEKFDWAFFISTIDNFFDSLYNRYLFKSLKFFLHSNVQSFLLKVLKHLTKAFTTISKNFKTLFIYKFNLS